MVGSLGLDIQKYYSTSGADDEEETNLTASTSEDRSNTNESRKSNSASA